MSEARRKRRQLNRKYAKCTAFISKLDILDTYTKLVLHLDTGLSESQIEIFKDYIHRRCIVDDRFKTIISTLDHQLIESIKSQLKDKVNE